MLTYSFVEWVKMKEEVLDEVRRRTVPRHAVMQEGGLRPNEGDFIVFDPILFFNKAIAAVQQGNQISPSEQDLNLGMLTQRQGTTGMVHKIAGDIHPEVYIIPDNFRDVSDAFNMDQVPEGRRFLVYMGLRRYSGQQHKDAFASARGLYNKWRSLASSNTDPGMVAVSNVILGPEAAKGEVVKQGKRQTNDFFLQQAQLAADPAHQDEIINNFKGDFAENPGLVRHLRNIGAGAIVDLFHDKGYPVPGEAKKPEPERSPLDQLMAGQQAEPMKVTAPGGTEFEPGSRIIKTNPQQLAAVGAAKEQPNQDAVLRRNLQKMFPRGRLDVAHHDPSLTGYGRRWKIHEDVRVYAYYPTA